MITSRNRDALNRWPTDLRTRSNVFAIMWSAGHMIHIAIHSNGKAQDPTEVAVFLAAVCLAMVPRSDRLLVLLAVAQIVDWWSFAPLNPDHWTLVMAVNSVLILGGLGRILWDRTTTVPLVEDVVGGLRVVLLVAYGAAALAKWNTTFLDPDVSCAADLFDQATFGVLGGGSVVNTLAVVSAVSAETLTFVLLLVPRTRRLGARLGLTFHSLVSLSPVMGVADFTATVSALFILFLPPDDIANAVSWLGAVNSRSPLLALIKRNRWVIPVFLILVGCVLGFRSRTTAALWLWFTVEVYQILLVLLPVLRVTADGGPEPRPSRPPTRARPPERSWQHVAIAAPAVLFLGFTAANPYLGLRTTGAFTMFSNLRTEAGSSNHLLGGRPIADYQDELLRITGSSIDTLNEAAEYDESIPVAALHGWSEVAGSESWIEGEIDGRPIRWTVADSAATIGQPSFFERYLLSFRSFDPDADHPRCVN